VLSVLRFDSSILPVDLWFAWLDLWDGYKTCTVHQHYTAKVTILMVTSVITQIWQSCSMTSSHNPKVLSVCVLLLRSPLSWWHQQVTWMWHHINCNQVSCLMSPSMGVTRSSSYPVPMRTVLCLTNWWWNICYTCVPIWAWSCMIFELSTFIR